MPKRAIRQRPVGDPVRLDPVAETLLGATSHVVVQGQGTDRMVRRRIVAGSVARAYDGAVAQGGEQFRWDRAGGRGGLVRNWSYGAVGMCDDQGTTEKVMPW